MYHNVYIISDLPPASSTGVWRAYDDNNIVQLHYYTLTSEVRSIKPIDLVWTYHNAILSKQVTSSDLIGVHMPHPVLSSVRVST